MILGEIVRVALEAIRSNKLRSFLTMLGIIIGIASVITMLALGEGAQRAVEEQVRSLGTDVLTVRPGQQFFGGVDRGDARLTIDDAEALQAAGGSIRAVAPEIESRVQVERAASNANLEVVGSWPSFFQVQALEVAAGRAFTPTEERGRRRVAVLGATVGEPLGGVDARGLVGSGITIAGVPFEVIGVLAAKGQQGWRDPDATVYIPYATAQFRVFGSERLRSIYVKTTGEEAMYAAIVEIDRVLVELRR